MNAIKYICLTIGLMGLIIATQNHQTDYELDAGCIKSFHEFAYEGPGNRNAHYSVKPSAPWQPVTLLPEKNSYFSVALSRADEEIWLIDRPFRRPSEIVIYKTLEQTWETISSYIGNTEFHVVKLFLTQDNQVWGQLHTESEEHAESPVPVLSRFNERTRRFEFVESAPEILRPENAYYYSNQIILDSDATFWILSQDTGIHRYDSAAGTTTLITTFQYIESIADAILSSDGIIYFISRDKRSRIDAPLDLYEVPVKTGEMRVVPVAGESRTLIDVFSPAWDGFFSLAFDSSGRLWLGSIGYRDVTNEWHLIHPPYLTGEKHHYLSAAPEVILESADGRMWFKKYLDTGGWGEGTAWYDPETNRGCLFTTYDTNIVEDSRNRLWMSAGGGLYRLDIDDSQS